MFLLVTLTGISREVDADLTAIAERRVVEVQTDWSHNGWDPSTAEVLAWNSSLDPATTLALQWQDSPEHWVILTDPSYELIGCAMAQVEWRWYGTCVLAGPARSGDGSIPVSAGTPIGPVVAESTPPVELLPNTAMP